jgi:hypothetical protein
VTNSSKGQQLSRSPMDAKTRCRTNTVHTIVLTEELLPTQRPWGTSQDCRKQEALNYWSIVIGIYIDKLMS